MTEITRAADLVARRLYEAGCRHAFGMPGGEVLTMVDALERAGIKFILCKHENAAGFMAEGVHHVNGAPAILVATLGPGVLNGVNVIANAHQDRVPMIILSGCVDADEALTYTHQVVDHQAVLAEITKASFKLTAEGADIIADKSVSIATAPRPGPVHIDVPISVADMEVTPKRLRRLTPATPVVPVECPDLDQARAWLSEAKRPVIIAGLDVLSEGSHAVLQAFAERFNIPVITSYKAKGILPENHPLCLGGAGLSPRADTVLIPFVEAADLIICAGYDPIEMRPGWREIWDPSLVNVIDIAPVMNDHYMHQATVNFIAHTGESLKRLAADVTPAPTWVEGEVIKAKQDLATLFKTTEIWGPAAVIAECRAAMPAGTIATADSGAHRILLSQIWECDSPRGLLQSSALCTMGCALPLAMGAKLAAPERQVISFSGDAGTLMCAGELATAAELGGNPIFVVFVDAELALIELKQRGRQMAKHGVAFGRHDFAALGRSLGGQGFRVTSRAELQAALQAAKTADTFTVIAAEIEARSYDGKI